MSLLHERYRVLRQLGNAGGFGHTFLAEDTFQGGHQCAIKRLKPVDDNALLYAEIRRRFEREAAVLQKLGEHANGQIPQLYDFFEDGGMLYLVQELISGMTLREKVESSGSLTAVATMEVLGKLLTVLEYVHAERIIHRDIKPENVMLRQDDGRPVLIDFGLVKEVINLDSRGYPTSSIRAGTPGYMAPEQEHGKPRFASDLYALGWTGIYLLTGKVPQQVDKSKIQELLLGVDSRFISIIERAIQFDDAIRYQSADQMLADVHYAGIRIRRLAEVSFTNRVGIDLVLIQPGCFQMGTKEGRLNESPRHLVTIKQPFYLGRYQITQAQWRAVTGASPSKFRGDDLPVESVSWNDVQTFLTNLNEINDGYHYRLPSEAEWEYACRAGSETKYCFGDDKSQLNRYAWYDENSDNRTHRVGEKEPNVWGLYDMHGNVGEWCSDTFHASYDGAPSDGSSWETESGPKERVLRGSAWVSSATECRSAFRRRNAQGNKGFHDGVRIVAVKGSAQCDELPNAPSCNQYPHVSGLNPPEQDVVPSAVDSTESCDISVVRSEQEQLGAAKQPIPMSDVTDAVLFLLKSSPNRRLRLTQLAHMLGERFPGQGKLAIRFGRSSMRDLLGAISQVGILDDHKTDPTVCLTADQDAGV